MTKKNAVSQWIQIGPEATPLPPMAASWEDYRQTIFLLKKVCADTNRALKKRKGDTSMYLIDNGGYASTEGLTILSTEGEEE